MLTVYLFNVSQVCGLCPSGWAMTSTGCMSCPEERELAPYRNAAIAIFAVFCFLAWFVLSWKPMFPTKVQNEIDQKGAKISKLKEKIQDWSKRIKSWQKILNKYRKKFKGLLGKDAQDQLKSLTRDRITQYLKLYISFSQVVSSFLTFHVQWPSLLLSTMAWIKGTLFLDIVQLPGLSCLWAGVNFEQKLFTYTLGPLVVVAAFLVPVVFAWAAGYSRKKELAPVWDALSDAAWRNVMFWIFLVFPVVSLTTLQAFDCEPAGLCRLAADFSQPCPTNDSLLRIWSFVFILVYPVGIPLFCFVSMVSMGVHLAARDKFEFNVLSAMVAKYTQCTTSIESQRIASLFTTAGEENDETNLKMHELWSMLTDGQGTWRVAEMSSKTFKGIDWQYAAELLQECANARKVLSADQFNSVMLMEKQVQKVYEIFFNNEGNLRNVTRKSADLKLTGIDPMSIQRFIQAYDQDGDGNISLAEFRDMVNDVVQKSSMFTGVEGDRLTAEQAVALLTFDWKPKVNRLAEIGGAFGRTASSLGADERNNSDGHSTNAGVEQQSKSKNFADDLKQDTEESKSDFERIAGLAKYAEQLEKGITKLVKRRNNISSKGKNAEEVEEREDGEKVEDEVTVTKEELRSRLQQQCKTDRNSVANQIWELGRHLLKHKVISVPDMTWSKGFSDTYMPSAENNEERPVGEDLEDFVIHPDIDDDYRITIVERLLASGGFKVPDDWRNVRVRKRLECRAISRVGFVFVAYKVNFWFWEIIEMLRK
jgi:hypothetical protein